MSHVHNEVRYEAAIERNIKFNRTKTNRRKWMAMEGAQRLSDLFDQTGEFEPKPLGDEWVRHPTVQAFWRDSFLLKMAATVTEWGGLTEGQHRAAVEAVARMERRMVEREVARAEAKASEAARSRYVGNVGDRMCLSLTLGNVLSFDGEFGTTYIHICSDEAGNTVVYKGIKRLGDRGAVVAVKATIKDHTVRDGVHQTIIARPATV